MQRLGTGGWKRGTGWARGKRDQVTWRGLHPYGGVRVSFSLVWKLMVCVCVWVSVGLVCHERYDTSRALGLRSFFRQDRGGPEAGR